MKRTLRLLFVALCLFCFQASAFAANSTNCFQVVANLDASTVLLAVPAGPAYSYTDLSTANFSTFFEIRDTLNGPHTVNLYFFHTANNSWTVLAFIDGADIPAGVSGVPALVGRVDLVFNSGGGLVSPSGDPAFLLSAQFTNGSAAQITAISLLGTTQLVGASTVSYAQDCASGLPNISDSALDFDEDFIDDQVYYRERSRSIVIRLSRTNTEQTLKIGSSADKFLVGDYTGDKNPDIVIWNYRAGFFLCGTPVGATCSSFARFQLGRRDDKPVRGDFDGDGVLDLAVWRKKDGKIYYLNSFNGFSGTANAIDASGRSDILLTGAAN